jgi:hypothetical protein
MFNDEVISITDEIPAPMVIRPFQLLHRLWKNPVTQRHLWYKLKYINYSKYVNKPDLYHRELARAAFWSFPAGIVISFIFFYVLQNIPEIVLNFLVPPLIFLILFVVVLFSFISRQLRNSPIKYLSQLAIYVHDMFNSDKLDPLLATPISDFEIASSIVLGYSASMLLKFINFVIGCLGMLLGFLVMHAFVSRIGSAWIDPIYFVPIVLALLLGVFPMGLILGATVQCMIVGLAIRMHYMAANLITGITAIVILYILALFILPLALMRGVSDLAISNIFSATTAYILFLAILFFFAVLAYYFMRDAFSSRRRG